MKNRSPKSKGNDPKTSKKAPKGFITIKQVEDKYKLSYDQIYWMIRNNYVDHTKIKKANTRPVYYVSEVDIQTKVECKNVTADDYERLRAEKLAVEIRLKKLKEEEYIEEIKSQEDEKFLRQMRWVFGDMKNWPEALDFNDSQREHWNQLIHSVKERLEQVG